jgi:hypothetical protein
LSKQLPEVSIRAVLDTSILLCKKVVLDAGEAVVIIKATEARRDAESTGQICRSRVSANWALLHTRMGIEYVG